MTQHTLKNDSRNESMLKLRNENLGRHCNPLKTVNRLEHCKNNSFHIEVFKKCTEIFQHFFYFCKIVSFPT